MARPENEFPTIRDARDRLSELIEQGFGDLPVQIIVVPDGTVQAIARNAGASSPVIMVELAADTPSRRLPVSLISEQRLHDKPIPSVQ